MIHTPGGRSSTHVRRTETYRPSAAIIRDGDDSVGPTHLLRPLALNWRGLMNRTKFGRGTLVRAASLFSSLIYALAAHCPGIMEIFQLRGRCCSFSLEPRNHIPTAV